MRHELSLIRYENSTIGIPYYEHDSKIDAYLL